jgi:hypothetical protein
MASRRPACIGISVQQRLHNPRNIPKRRFRQKYPDPKPTPDSIRFISLSRPSPLTFTRARRLWPMNGPKIPPIPARGLACLTTHSPSSTFLVDEKGYLFWLFGNCRENETGFNTPNNVFNELAGQARGFCSRFHGNSQRAFIFPIFERPGATS